MILRLIPPFAVLVRVIANQISVVNDSAMLTMLTNSSLEACLLSYFASILSTPISTSKLSGLNKSEAVCDKCRGGWKPARSYHCRLCERCVFKMDHHCIWIGSCVGFHNQKAFILFLVYLIVNCMCEVLLLLLFIVGPIRVGAHPGAYLKVLRVLALLAFGFVIYNAWGFLMEQIECITTDTTLVETYKGVSGIRKGTVSDRFRAVFGQRWYVWPIPLTATPVPDFLESVTPTTSVSR